MRLVVLLILCQEILSFFTLRVLDAKHGILEPFNTKLMAASPSGSNSAMLLIRKKKEKENEKIKKELEKLPEK